MEKRQKFALTDAYSPSTLISHTRIRKTLGQPRSFGHLRCQGCIPEDR